MRAAVAVAAIILLLYFLLCLFKGKKKFIILACASALLFSMIFSGIYFDNWFYADRRFDETVKIKGTIIEIVDENTHSGDYIIETYNIADSPLSTYKLSLHLDREIADGLVVGSIVSFSCNLEPHSNKKFAYYKYAAGLSASCQDVTDFTLYNEERFVHEEYFRHIREWLTRRAIILSDENSGQMVSALLLGERQVLSDKVNLDFERLGITHILALSGMHLALLAIAVERLFSLIRLHKNLRVFLTVVFTLLYMTLTGFPSSVLRAGIMLIISSAVFLISREPDSVTSLLLSIAIIIFISPYAVFDISLWLSALAALGVIIYAEYNGKRARSKHKILTYIIDSLIMSGFAISATLLVSHICFDGLSIISPLATLIFTPLTTLIMYFGIIMLFIGEIIPVGFILKPIVSFTCYIADVLSSFDIFVSDNHIIIDILIIILTILFFIFITFDIKKKKVFATVILTAFCLLYITSGVIGYINDKDDLVAYSCEETHNSFIIRSNGESCFISSSKYSEKSGYTSVSALYDAGVMHLNKYYMTHLSMNSEEELSAVLSNVLTDEVYIPKAQNSDEEFIIEKISAATKEYKTKIHFYDSYSKTYVGNFEIIPIVSSAYGEDNAQNAFFIHGEGENILYLSSGILEGTHADLVLESLRRTSCVIFGSHGTNYKTPVYLKAEYDLLSKIVVDGERIYLTPDAAVAYNKNGCEIYSHPKTVILFD